MTLLNYYLSDNEIILIMDTLSSYAVTKQPHCFCTKFFPLPHLDMIMCGTGLHNVIIKWFELLSSNMVAKDIDHLNEFTPNILKDIFKENILEKESATSIYHFGINKEDKFIGYKYWSVDNFEPFALPRNGWAYKPDSERLRRFLSSNDTYDFWDIVTLQYTNDKKEQFDKKVGIGGDIIVCSMSREGIGIKKLFSFIDSKIMFNEMLIELSKQNNPSRN